jgi:putative transposase
MRTFLDAHADWLTVIRLPAYAAELNAVESVWAHLKGSIANTPSPTSTSSWAW